MQVVTQTITLNNQTWELHPEKAVYWHEQKTLILSDIHLGKSGHFRKSGIAAPAGINESNLTRLERLINQFKPIRIRILGDLFHSDINREWFQFEEWRHQFNDIQFQLVIGNHDSLHNSFYESAQMDVFEKIVEHDFHFVHDPTDQDLSEKILVGGHIHPSVKMKGKGRQRISLPCFLISERRVLLPAFGTFTGNHTIKPTETDLVYTVVDNTVIQIDP